MRALQRVQEQRLVGSMLELAVAIIMSVGVGSLSGLVSGFAVDLVRVGRGRITWQA